jgi:hypothetical protein
VFFKLDWTNAPFVRLGKKFKLKSVSTLVAKNGNEAIVAPVLGSGGVCVLRTSGVCNQAVGFVLVCFAGIWLVSP